MRCLAAVYLGMLLCVCVWTPHLIYFVFIADGEDEGGGGGVGKSSPLAAKKKEDNKKVRLLCICVINLKYYAIVYTCVFLVFLVATTIYRNQLITIVHFTEEVHE